MESLPIKLIVGLGNPGAEYENTRHNVGVWFLNRLLAGTRFELKPEKKFKGDVVKATLYDHEIFLLAPTTFMNLSGESVLALARFYKIAPQEILVVHDELDLPCGTVRLKQGGGHGGHNGLQSIIQHIGTQDFLRLRLGIDHPGHKDLVSDYVLSKPKPNQSELMEDAIADSLRVVPQLLSGNLADAMQELHSES